METNSEVFVFVLVAVGLVIWLGYGLKKWLEMPLRRSFPGMDRGEKPGAELVRLLEDHGYDTLCGKLRVVLDIAVDQRLLTSRIYVDGIARDEDGVYAIKLAKRREHVDWTGSGVRDAFLPYLSLGNIQGVLYVELSQKEVKKITFEWDENG